MTADRELLEAAAKAAGLTIEYWAQDDYPVVRDGAANVGWNPLVFDSDALRLAVKLGLYIEGKFTAHQSVQEFIDLGELVAVRRAIVRAAAAMAGLEPGGRG